ncbi:hypothetical protein B0H13DRAFT_1866647 [Mycena leptocephala]|nr:hypothetical protein B0H13DRAFT_1866647 [Mycena leptocephala]
MEGTDNCEESGEIRFATKLRTGSKDPIPRRVCANRCRARLWNGGNRPGAGSLNRSIDLKGRKLAMKLGTQAMETGKKFELENGNINLKGTTTGHNLKHSRGTWIGATSRLLLRPLDMDENPRKTRQLEVLAPAWWKTQICQVCVKSRLPNPGAFRGQHLKLEAGQWEKGPMRAVEDTVVLHGVGVDEGTEEGGSSWISHANGGLEWQYGTMTAAIGDRVQIHPTPSRSQAGAEQL